MELLQFGYNKLKKLILFVQKAADYRLPLDVQHDGNFDWKCMKRKDNAMHPKLFDRTGSLKTFSDFP